MVSFTEFVIRALLRLQRRSPKAAHLKLGNAGEIEAYFYLKQLGYRIVATNFRAAHDRGEIDLIGWDGAVLCFVEVKTRTDVSFAPPSAAVTPEKQGHIRSVARRYLRHLSSRPPCRFDIVSVVPSSVGGPLQPTLRKGAFSWESGKTRRFTPSGFYGRHFLRRR